MGKGIFDPLQNRHPFKDHQKFVTDDYVGRSATPTAMPYLVHIRPRGLLGEWVKYN